MHHHNLFVRSRYGYLKCRSRHRTAYAETETIINWESLPHQAQPVEAHMSGAQEWSVNTTTQVSLLSEHRRQPVATFEDYLSTLEAWEQGLLRHSTLFADAFSVSYELQTSFVAGSDGSEKYGTDGAFGWMISTSQGVRTASGMGPSRGLRMDSYRAECSPS